MEVIRSLANHSHSEIAGWLQQACAAVTLYANSD
jgi:hypothetical protein